MADRRQLTLRLPSALEAPVRTAADHADIASATLLVLIVGARHGWPLPSWALDRRWRPGAEAEVCAGHPKPGTFASLSAALQATEAAVPAHTAADKRGW